MEDRGRDRDRQGADLRLSDYLARTRDRALGLSPWLVRVDLQALAQLEEQYQRELHDNLFSLRVSDETELAEVLGWVKGARAFLLWLEVKAKQAEEAVSRD